MNPHKYSYIFLFVLFTSVSQFSEARSTSNPPEETLESHIAPEGRQGILEIPKQAATIIRTYIDDRIRNYFGLTTPVPVGTGPPELKDSLVGSFLLGNFPAMLPPAPSYTPELAGQLTQVKPIYISNEPSYIGHSPLIVPATQPPPKAPTTEKTPAPQTEESKNKPKVPAVTGEKVHVLETDTSLSGIFNSFGSQLSTNSESKPKPTKENLASTDEFQNKGTTKPRVPAVTGEKVHVLETDTSLSGIFNSFDSQLSSNSKPKPTKENLASTDELQNKGTAKPKPKPGYGSSSSNTQFLETDAFLSNPYGLLANKNPDDEVYWVPDASLIIPIKPSTTPPPETTTAAEEQTEAITVETTTEDEDEEGEGEEDVLKKKY